MTSQIDALNKVVTYYQSELQQSNFAKDYLKSRNITDETIFKFQIGYAPNNPKYSPRFRNRIIFPIWNASGILVGWTGRTLNNSPAKYLNTRESALFKKKQLLYLYHFAKKQIFNTQEVILVEGQMDAITLYQAGITNVVATSGTTSFSELSALLLGRYANRVYIIFDTDEAGIKAELAVKVFLESVGIPEIISISLPSDHDPDTYLNKHSTQEFIGLLHGPNQTTTSS